MRWDGEVPGVPGACIVTVPGLPATLPGAIAVGPHSQARHGALLRVVPGVARYLVTGGARIDVAPEPAADPADVETFLFGGVRAALIHQRGEYPLHATTVAPPDGTIALAIAGESGTGKSTLAAELVLRGWSLLGDDLTRVVCDGDRSLGDRALGDRALGDRVLAWPGRAGIRLMADACVRLGIARDTLRRAATEVEKFLWPVPTLARPLQLTHVVALHRQPSPCVEHPTGADGVAFVVQQTFRPNYIAALGTHREHLRNVTRLATHCRLARVSGHDGVRSLADRICALLDRPERAAT